LFINKAGRSIRWKKEDGQKKKSVYTEGRMKDSSMQTKMMRIYLCPGNTVSDIPSISVIRFHGSSWLPLLQPFTF
jgi:hypothetical protein